MIKYKYRIKTKQEFIDEFGENWRNVKYGYVEEMDYLLGQDIDPKCYEFDLDVSGNRLKFSSELCVSFHTFSLSDQMIKEIQIGVDYNKPRKLIYE